VLRFGLGWPKKEIAMNRTLNQEMMSYYDARAREYDEVYVGKGPASIPNPDLYRRETEITSKLVQGYGRGHSIDIGCGTGHWVPYYVGNCSDVALLDHSEKMLSQCRKRIRSLGLEDKSYFIQGDFFEVILDEDSFDSAFIGFFITHLSPNLEEIFFSRLKRILKSSAQLMIVDSSWSSQRMHSREKQGMQERTLNDGRAYALYKRYFDKPDIERMFQRYDLKLKSCWMGDTFLVAQGEKPH